MPDPKNTLSMILGPILLNEGFKIKLVFLLKKLPFLWRFGKKKPTTHSMATKETSVYVILSICFPITADFSYY